VPLSPAEIERYARHLTLTEVGRHGQERLAAASVLLVGAGGLGSPMALYLAAAGIGCIGIVEFDVVDRSNLHRQILFGEGDVGKPKMEVAAERLADINPHVRIIPHSERLDVHNAREIIRRYDVVADGSDTFAVKYLANDACVLEGKPLVYGSVLRFQGEVAVFGTEDGPCYRCLYPSPPPADQMPTCAEAGVLGVMPGLVGTLQATEVIKLILDLDEPLAGRLLRIDALQPRFQILRVDRDPGCPICGHFPTQTDLLPDYGEFCSSEPDTVSMPVPVITVRELKERLDRGEKPFILDVRRQNEYDIANLNGHLIPLDQLLDRVDEIEEHRDDELVVVHCRTGARSARAVELLRQVGFQNAVNLKGGTHAWSDEIDPDMPKY
jgi:sulfur-carrier protein adenylyltransferase/sulfurtransferase